MLPKENEKQLGQIAQVLVREFRKADLTYDQSRQVIKLARTSLDLKPSRKGRTLPKSLSEDQIEKFFSVISDPTLLLQFQIAYFCGLRVSALCELKRVDVCLDTMTVSIQWSKTNSGRICFPRKLKAVLRMHLAATGGNTYLFQSNHGQKGPRPHSTRTLQLRFKHFAKMAGLPPDVAIHSLRHSCLTHLARRGLSSAQIQAISLHRSKSSLDSYVALSQVDVMDSYQEAFK